MFVCSVGDEVATANEQLRAKNDRQALVVKYRKLQAEFDKLAAKKKADNDVLTQELRDLTEQKRKEMLEVTCSHTLQMTQLQSSLMADIDIYYTKSKFLENEADKKQDTIRELTEKINFLEEELHHQRIFATTEKQSIPDSATATHSEEAAFTTGSSITQSNTVCSNESLMLVPPPCSPGSSSFNSLSLNCNQVQSQGQEQSSAMFSPSLSLPTMMSPDSMCEGLTLSSVQRWNENLRTELQRVHIEQESGARRIESLKDALAKSEEERSFAEEHCDALQDQVEALVNSKQEVLAVVQKVQKENAELKKELGRMKLL